MAFISKLELSQLAEPLNKHGEIKVRIFETVAEALLPRNIEIEKGDNTEWRIVAHGLNAAIFFQENDKVMGSIDWLPIEKGATSLRQAAELYGLRFLTNRDLQGLAIAIGEIIGPVEHLKIAVVPRTVIIQANQLLSGSLRARGAAVMGVELMCPRDNARKQVRYYDPDNPPLCRCGQVMVLVDIS